MKRSLASPRRNLSRLPAAAALLLAALLASAVHSAPEPLPPAQVSLNAARQALAKPDPARAIELLRTASTQEPHWLLPHQYLAVAYQMAGQAEEARAEYLSVQRTTRDWTLSGRTNAPESRDDLVQAEAEAAFLINQSRLAQKLSLLRPDPLLAICAREHSFQMRDQQQCEHSSSLPGCRTALDRFRLLFGYLPVLIAENIARTQWGRDEKGMVERVAQLREQFMDSPGHRSNTLHRELARLGVGLALSPDGTLWTTELFAQAPGDGGGER